MYFCSSCVGCVREGFCRKFSVVVIYVDVGVVLVVGWVRMVDTVGSWRSSLSVVCRCGIGLWGGMGYVIGGLWIRMLRCGVSILWGRGVGVTDCSCRGMGGVCDLCGVLRGMSGGVCGMGRGVSYVVDVVVGVCVGRRVVVGSGKVISIVRRYVEVICVCVGGVGGVGGWW